MQITIVIDGNEKPHQLLQLASFISEMSQQQAGAGGVSSTPIQGEARTATGTAAHMYRDAPEQPDPAAVFGASVAPLSGAHFTAAATPSTTAQTALPGSAAVVNSGTSASAPTTGQPDGAGPQDSAAPTLNHAGIEVDKSGLPWDERIHAGTKSKTKGGLWVAKRGVNDDAFVKRVEAELRAFHAESTDGGDPDTGAAVNDNPAAVFGVTTPSEPAGALPPLLPALLPGTPAPAPAGPPQDFESMMSRLTAAIKANVLPEDVLAAACARRQLPGPIFLLQNPQHIPTIWGDIQASYPALV